MITVKVGDITQEEVCAVVNAANPSLMGGGGVDGAIHRAGGPEILEACKVIRNSRYPGGLPTSGAVATTAGALPCRYVIHTVGPIYGRCGDACDRMLGDAYKNALHLALELGCASIAFPAISTGIYGFPAERAARIAYAAVHEVSRANPNLHVIFIFHTPQNRDLFESAIEASDFRKSQI